MWHQRPRALRRGLVLKIRARGYAGLPSMSRKAREHDKQAQSFATPKIWFAKASYSLPKLGALFGNAARGALVVLHLPDANQVHPLMLIAQASKALLEAGSAESAVVIVDLSPLLGESAVGTDLAAKSLDAEGRAAALSHNLGKPASRVLCKLLGSGMQDVTLLASGGTAQLALKLLSATLDERALRSVRRLVLVHPRLPAACINAQLSHGAAERYAAVNGLELDVVFESASIAESRLPALRHVFPTGQDSFAVGESSSLLAHAIRLAAGGGGGGGGEAMALAPIEDFDPEWLDPVGRSLWLCELSFVISRQTKQHEAIISEATQEFREAAASASRLKATTAALGGVAVPNGASAAQGAVGSVLPTADPAAADADADKPMSQRVGALVLRGNRCVLVRSLAAPPAWRGMRLPAVEPTAGEAPLATAVRAAAELCDIDGTTEVSPIEEIPPVKIFTPGGGRIALYVLYASRGPPPGPLEDQDQTDDEDLYDWYTWPRAMAALVADTASIAALKAMAYSLGAAAKAGVLPDRWGGVFGQEFTAVAERAMSSADARSERPSALTEHAAAPTPTGSSGRAGRREQILALLRDMPLAEVLDCSAAVAAAAATRFRGEATDSTAARAEPLDGEAAGGGGQDDEDEACKFRSRRPFHPSRLHATFTRLAERTARGDGDVRVEGLAWLASQPKLQALVRTSASGAVVVEPGAAWWACIPRESWPPGLVDDLAPLWRDPHGDRQTELAILTQHAHLHNQLRAELEACVLSEAETAEAAAEEAEPQDDPYWDEWRPILEATAEDERAAKIESDVRNAFQRASLAFNDGGRVTSAFATMACAPCD